MLNDGLEKNDISINTSKTKKIMRNIPLINGIKRVKKIKL